MAALSYQLKGRLVENRWDASPDANAVWLVSNKEEYETKVAQLLEQLCQVGVLGVCTSPPADANHGHLSSC